MEGDSGSGFLKGQETRREVSETLQMCLWSHTPRSCSLLGQAEFLAAGQQAGLAGMSTAFPDGKRPQEIPTLNCLLTFQLLAEKRQASLAEIMDDPGHLSFKLLGSE